MTADLLVNLLATGIAFVLGLSSRTLYGRITRRRRASAELRSREQRHPRYSTAWLVAYYRRRGRECDLYATECAGTRLVVPLIVGPAPMCLRS
jgi:hypothetical protein